MKQKNSALVSLLVIALTACGILPKPLVEKPIPTPAGNIIVLNDTFDSNGNYWHESIASGFIQVQNGELYLSSVSTQGGIGLGWCEGCKPFNDEYYFEAEVSLDSSVTLVYGIAFGIAAKAYAGLNYYAFIIDQQAQRYVLTKFNFEQGFSDIAKGMYDGIREYPANNTLGVFFDKGIIQLYINGKMIAIYSDDNPIVHGRIGFFIEAAGANLIADNVTAYEINP